MAAIAAITVGLGTVEARATVIDFENVDTTNAPFNGLITGGDYVTQNGYYFQGLEYEGATGTLVGALFNGADSSSCLSDQCPRGNATNYIGALNDGIIAFGRSDGGQTTLLGFDAAFLASPDANPIDVPGLLAIQTNFADGGNSVVYYQLGAIGTGGKTSFNSYRAPTLQAATSFYAFGLRCDTAGYCKPFATNEGQFAFDNIRFDDTAVAAVPEPATWAMMLAGFSMIGFASRRRSNVRTTIVHA
ncbi:NF038120 family PEP-CTERM protein [Sphingomonas sp. PAMC 26617]|uniref:NF038120 family PEP-CTERM protein n=1 Tax=Sphingomonas sp. PAMC 26617 TaxID=1112216 RepID=UPI0018DED38E